MRLLKTATKRKEKEVENEEKNLKSHIISITLLFLVLFTRGIISVVQEGPSGTPLHSVSSSTSTEGLVRPESLAVSSCPAEACGSGTGLKALDAPWINVIIPRMKGIVCPG